jgi:hypothetical protein
MNATLSTQTALEFGLVLLLLIGTGVWLIYQHHRKQSSRLQQKFGPEYGRTVVKLGRTKAESTLKARVKRVERLQILPLERKDAERFIQSWNALQARFIDDPRGIVMQADQLVREVMQKRGYPMGDFDSRVADISVDHPAVVENFRLAQAVAVRAKSSEASTEELRKAVVHYRALFDDLLEVWDSADEEAEHAEVHP